jgi:hypothetical protein
MLGHVRLGDLDQLRAGQDVEEVHRATAAGAAAAVLEAATGAHGGVEHGELALSRTLLGALKAGDVLLADGKRPFSAVLTSQARDLAR